jgi:hypothetical protein
MRRVTRTRDAAPLTDLYLLVSSCLQCNKIFKSTALSRTST